MSARNVQHWLSSVRVALLALSLLSLASGCSSDLSAPTARIVLASASVAVGAQVSLDGSGSSDPQGIALAYAWRFATLPAGSSAVLVGKDGAAAWFVPDVSGSYTVELVVSDGALASTPSSATIVAGPCGGNAPTISSVAANPALPSAGDTVQLTADATDADLAESCGVGEELTYAWSFVDKPAGSASELSSPALANPSFVADEPGDYVVRLRVTDAAGHASEPAVFTLSVAGCPVPNLAVGKPAATPPAPTTGELVTLSVIVKAEEPNDAGAPDAGSDASAGEAGSPDAGPTCTGAPHATYHWTLIAVPAGSKAVLVDSPLVTPSFLADVPGDYVAEVWVMNAKGHASNLREVKLTVSACGSAAPVVSAVATSPASPSAGESVGFSATVTDADTQAPCSKAEHFDYAWKLVSLPIGSQASLNDATLTNPSFLADVAGTYGAELVVTDGEGHASAVASASVTVAKATTTACGTQPPVVSAMSATPTSVSVGQYVGLAATVSDPDTQAPCSKVEAFGYHWSFVALPVGSHATLNDEAITDPSFSPDVAGTYTVQLVATDGEGHASLAQSVTVTATGGATGCGTNAPVVSNLAAAPAAPSTGSTVVLSATVSDADTQPPCSLTENLSLEWTLLTVPAGSNAKLSGATQATPWLVTDVPGAYVVRAIVTDSGGHASVAKTLTITASACGSAPPVVSAINVAPAAPKAGTAVGVSATITDADTGAGCGLSETFTYAWSLTTTPAGSAAVLNGATQTSPSFVADVAGTYVVSLVATDSEGHKSASVSKSITVTAPSTCGQVAPVALLAGITGGTCPGTCTTATVSPAPPAPPAPGPTSYVVTANGHVQILLDGMASYDPDNLAPCSAGQSLAWSWTILSAPVGSAVGWSAGGAVTTTMAAPTLDLDLKGVYLVRLVVSDGAHDSAAIVVQVNY